MIKFEKIEPGMKLWDVRKAKRSMFSTSKWCTWPVYVAKVDPENRRVFASWNGNPYEWMSERCVTKYRKKRP